MHQSADWDVEGPGVVILEDLVEAGGSFGKSTRPITIEEASKALGGLAALHASFWGRADTELTWLPMSTHSLTTSGNMSDVLVWGQPSLAPLARCASAAENLQSLKLLNA